jgi:hypothetical protein
MALQDPQDLISSCEILFHKLANHPDLRNLLIDEAKKLAELAEAKEANIGIMLMVEMATQGVKVRSQAPAEAQEIRKMIQQAKQKIAKLRNKS